MSEPATPHRERINILLAIISTIAVLLAQTAGLFMWGAKLDNRVAQLEQRALSADKLAETVARVDERTASLVTTVNRIEERVSDQDRRR